MKVNNLTTIYKTDEGIVKAVDDVSFDLARGEILGILGESGSGKSTIAHSIMRLIYPPGKIVAGEIIFNNKDLLKLSEAEMINIRGAKISMIFQDPFTSLNPVYTIGDQIAEAISLHQGLNKKDAFNEAIQMLETVHIKDPEKRVHDYPHQFSGGMRQRAMIAMALACQPEILIADEPTTALDVTIQAEILKLIKEIQEKFKLSVIYITHNFGIIKAICQKVMVLYKGKVVEAGEVDMVLSAQKHPYTKRLIKCLELLRR